MPETLLCADEAPTFKRMRSWPGTGDPELHRAQGRTVQGPVEYWSLIQKLEGEEVPVGKIYRDDLKERIEKGLKCLSIMEEKKLPPDPELLRKLLDRLRFEY